MAFHLLRQTIIVATPLASALAQSSAIIPSDLTAGFNDKEVQVSFSAKAVDGFVSGTTFEKDAVTTEPTFALGDSNGISPSTRYTLIMVDTTCPSARTLHYVRSNFQFSFAGGTNIETSSPPLLDYKAPGAFGEQSDGRQYVFLMYTNPQRREFQEMQLPSEGASFDVSKFQSDNGLKDPVAGVGMVVKLGGTADCGGQDANQAPSGLSTAAPATSAVALSSTVKSTPASATATSDAVQLSSVISASSTSAAENEDEGTSTFQSTSPIALSSALETDDAAPTVAPSTVLVTSQRTSVTESPTTSGNLVEQTANAAPTNVRGIFVGPLIAVMGVLAW
jgi:hypothetical protein